MRQSGRQLSLSIAVLVAFPFLVLNEQAIAGPAPASNVFPTAGNAGVGTTTPSGAKLDVIGGAIEIAPADVHSDAALTVSSANYGGWNRLTQMAPATPSTSALNLMGSTNSGGSAQWFSWGVNNGVWTLQPGTIFSGSAGLFVDTSGNVGVGTSTPGANLSVDGSAPANQIGEHIYNSDASGYSVLRLGTHVQSAVGGAIHYFNSSWSGSGAYAPSTLNFTSWGSGGLSLAAASGPLTFFTVDTAPSNERLRIDPSGNVGIGTTTPGAKLEVNGNLQLTQGSGSSIKFADGTIQTTAYTAAGSSSVITESGGNVGIGTTTPANKLDVNGGINMDSGTLNLPNGDGAKIDFYGTAQPNHSYIATSPGYAVNLYTNGTQNMTWASGNVGIGTTNPGASLDIGAGYAQLSSGGSPWSKWYSDGSFSHLTGEQSQGLKLDVSGSTAVTVLGGGNVGIGTTNPRGPLEIDTGAVGGSNATLALVQTNAANGNYYSNLGLYNSNGMIGNISVLGAGYPAGNIWTANDLAILAGQDNPSTNLLFLTNTNGDIKFGTGGYSITNERMVVAHTGNVGIGTATPGARLEVNGNVLLTQGAGASITFSDGSVQTKAWNGVLNGADYAESVDVAGSRSSYEPGDVLILDAVSGSDIAKSAEPYSTLVAGIYATKPGALGTRKTTDPRTSATEIPMAMVGIVPTKVTTENGPIRKGDLLVSSSKPGYAMKGTDRNRMLGAVVGKAMGSLDSGTGVIQVLVTLQ